MTSYKILPQTEGSEIPPCLQVSLLSCRGFMLTRDTEPMSQNKEKFITQSNTSGQRIIIFVLLLQNLNPHQVIQRGSHDTWTQLVAGKKSWA